MTVYLLRFDDLCPTMNWPLWEHIETWLIAEGLSPIVAIVPANADPNLMLSPPQTKVFWQNAQAWQARGWVIGLHGYRHSYDGVGASLVPLKSESEFSGHSYEVQRARIINGLNLLRRQGLRPRVWVAPGHAFDAVTLRVLREIGISVISDGFGFRPTTDASGTVWVPQQLWRQRRIPFGCWTICCHHNHMTESDLRGLQRFVSRHRSSFCDDFQALVNSATRETRLDRCFGRVLFMLAIAKFRWFTF